MDPFLFSLVMAWLLVHAAEEVPYAVRGKVSPRMAAKLAKARDARATAGQPTTRRSAARDFFSALWADAWTDADRTRRRLRDERPVKKAEGRLWWQRARRGGKAIGNAVQDLADWAFNREPPPVRGLDDPADFAKAAEAADDQQPPRAQPDPEDPRAAADPPPPRQDPPPRQQPTPDPRESVWATATRMDVQHRPPVNADQQPVLDAEVVCDGGASCRNSELGVQEAIARGLCPGCGGRRELVWNFGGEHGHRTCPECGGTGRHTPFSTTRLQLEAANSEENPTMSSNAEVTRITQAIEFAAGMAEEARGGVTSMETFTESLIAGEVEGRPLELTASAQEIYTQIASIFDQLRAELERHLVIAESYAAVPDAGNKAFNTDA
jgi:hypothetical protein